MAFGQPPTNAPGFFSFDPESRAKIVKAGQGARILGIVMFVEAALALVNGNIISGAASGIPGMFFFQGGNALKRMEFDQHNDIPHLMEGYDKLSKMFLTRLIVLAVMFVMFAGMAVLIWWLIASGTLEEWFSL